MLRSEAGNVQNIGSVDGHSVVSNGNTSVASPALSAAELSDLLRRKDEQIDRLLHIIDNLSGPNNK